MGLDYWGDIEQNNRQAVKKQARKRFGRRAWVFFFGFVSGYLLKILIDIIWLSK